MKTPTHLFTFKTASVVILVTSILAAPFYAATPDAGSHAAHVASGAMPPSSGDTANRDAALSLQLSQLQMKVAELEAALAKNNPKSATGGMPGMAAPTAPMAGMSSEMPPGGMMGKMDKMMGKMDKMMSMGGGAMPTGTPAAGMGGMGMEQEMMGMSPGGGMATPTALPGFPGASHLYHIGSTDFFLDHGEHIALTVQQQEALNPIKQKALLDKAATQRNIDAAEQELWTLTASDQPNVTNIEAKVRDIEKLRADQRLNFIRAVGSAGMILTDAQRQSLLGLQPPQPSQGMQSMPSASGSTPGGMSMPSNSSGSPAGGAMNDM